MKKLYRYNLYCGRQGEVVGLFVADEKEIKKAIGKVVYFGEILGKHSEVATTLGPDDFTMLTADKDFIEKFEKFECASGHNPLGYLEEEA